MSTRITFRRGTAAPTQASGLTLGEPAFDSTNRNLYVGLGPGVTAAWVGARITGLSADIAAGLTNWIVNAKAVNDYFTSLGAITPSTAVTWTALQTFTAGISAAGGITLASPNLTGTPLATTAAIGTNTTQIATTAFVQNEIIADTVTSIDGVTGAITNVARTNAGNTFSVVQVFNAGISAAGGITFNGAFTGATATFNRLSTFTAGLSADGALTFNGTITGATATFSRLVTGNAGFSGALTGTATNASALGGTAAASWALLASPTFTGTPAAPTPAIGTNTTQIATTAFVQSEIIADTVTSVNGATGAITNVARTNAGNTFSVVQVFNSGISAAGGITFANDILVNLLTIGRGSGSPFNTASVAIGIGALSSNVSGGSNTGVGYSALSGNSGGSNNTAIGNDALRVVEGGANTAVGNQALRELLTGGNNVAVGFGAGRFGSTGPFGTTVLVEQSSDSVFIGSDSRPSNTGTTAEIVIGANAVGLGSNTAVIGATTQSAAFIYGMVHALGGISAAGATINGPLTGATATFSRLVTGNAGFSGALTGTATNASALGGTAAASWAQLAAANTFTGINTFNAGVTLASTLDVTGLAKFNGNVTVGDAASDVLTVTSGATFGITDHSGVARFAAGVTFSSTTDHAGVARFAAGITANTIDISGTSRFTGDVSMGATLTVSGNLIVNGTTTTINSTTISVDDKNIVLGDIVSPTDAGADGGGFTLKGTTDKNFYWKQSNAGTGNTLDVGGAWNSDQNFNLASISGKFFIHQAEVLSKTALGPTVVGSSLTSVGIVTGGTWNSGIVYVDGGVYS